MHRIWATKAIDKVVMARKGVFQVRFTNLQDKRDVLQMRVYFFDKKSFIVKAWNEGLTLDISSLQSLPIWVQLPELDIKYWRIECLSKLGSMLGIPIKTDKITKEKSTLSYARLLIEMPLNGPFPEHIDFINDWDVVVRQKVTYEWKLTQSSFCQMLGYKELNCRKKGKTRQEWRPVRRGKGQQEVAIPLSTTAPQHTGKGKEQEGYITPKTIVQGSYTHWQIPIHSPMQNTFQVLMNAEESTDGLIERRDPLHMDNIITWNIRGLNSPNKQEDAKIFLEKHRVGLVALLEIKIKEKNVKVVGER